jgi:hypothetical protein
MDTKLTLKLDKNVIEKAKIYAAEQERSLSKIIESYLQIITSSKEGKSIEKTEITPFVKSISKGKGEISADLDYKKEYYEHLLEKYK